MQNSKVLFIALALATAATVHAQGTDPNANYPQYPQPAAYPPANGMVSAPSPKQTMRSQFAASLLQVAQATGSGAMVVVADGLTGALRDWFDRRRMKQAMPPTQGYAQPQGYTQPQGYAPPQPQNVGGYPVPTSLPPAYDPNALPNGVPFPGADGSMGGSPQVTQPSPYSPDPNMGQGTGDPGGGGQTNKSQMYAGIAFEIHLVSANGATTAVDPATYSFRTGDQFRVYYRPALPGRVDVFNVNAAGQNAQIDNINVAAGELASLGPYEFTNLTGEETLILRLSPCVTETMMSVTRDIVKSQDTSSPAMGPQIASCNDVITRGIKPRKTRDIKKVSMEGGTSFALDPISANEMSSGQFAPRQVTITLHHL
ncbi:MAG TPA: hypothetical protein VGO61_02880 [Steroidobacteraceae bacterium]|jgi:hypothetical protein|nr:hypothetical protein [Steroidobacteraceae bacterium]